MVAPANTLRLRINYIMSAAPDTRQRLARELGIEFNGFGLDADKELIDNAFSQGLLGALCDRIQAEA